MQQYAVRGKNKIHTSLFTHSLERYLRKDLLDTWNREKNVCKKSACKYHEPGPIEMPQMEAFTYPDTIQTGGFGIMSGTIQNSQ